MGFSIFIAPLFTISKTWQQPKCPLTDEWIKKLWFIYTMEYYSAIKRNTFESVLMRWIAGTNINNLRYADDTKLMEESRKELKSLAGSRHIAY